VDLGADVINMSFGTAEGELEPGAPLPHIAAIRYAATYGCVLVAAAGNSGRLEKFYPAALPDVIAVTSVDRGGRRSSFSTYGSHCALAAPGEDIVSMGIRGYRMSSGTSHAAPFVSGAAALLVARARRAGRELNGGQVRDLLVASAAPLGGGGFSPETGHGLLDAASALRRLDATLVADRSTGRAS
jgi:subtilisin family serine protease